MAGIMFQGKRAQSTLMVARSALYTHLIVVPARLVPAQRCIGTVVAARGGCRTF